MNTISSKLFYDKKWRRALRKNAHLELRALNYKLEDNVDILVITNTKNTTYVILPDNNYVVHNDLTYINVARSDCASTVATGSTVATLTSTAGTFGTLSCAGSADVRPK